MCDPLASNTCTRRKRRVAIGPLREEGRGGSRLPGGRRSEVLTVTIGPRGGRSMVATTSGHRGGGRS
jgi:hypothetical protein